MNSIAPVWDGNETWLVLGGGGLMAAFPLAYAIIMPALYRRSSPCCWRWCSAASPSSSAGATRATHVLGRRLHPRLAGGGVGAGHHARRAAAGHRRRRPRLWRRLVGLADAVQPADRRRPGRAAMRCSAPLADLEERGLAARRMLSRWRCASPSPTIVGMAAVSAWTPFLAHDYYRRWFAWPQVLFTAQVPLLVAVARSASSSRCATTAATGRS